MTQRLPRFLLLAGIAFALTLYRIWVINHLGIDLYVDEAYYWGWSQALDWGYFSKPPLIAALIGGSTALLGKGLIAVKLPSLLLYPFTAGMLYLLGKRLYSEEVGFWAGLGFLSMPLVSALGLFVSTDAPLLFFWSCALWFLLKGLDQDQRGNGWGAWLALGVVLGLGLMSKYTMAAFLPSALLLLLIETRHRVWLGRPQPWVALVIAAAILAPNLYWNWQHDFPTFRHTADITRVGQGGGRGFHPGQLGEFIGAQWASIGPVAGILLGWALVRWRRLWLEARHRLLLIFTVPLLLLVSFQALTGRANGNWAAPIFVGGMLLITGAFFYDKRRWVVSAVMVNLLIATLAYHWPDAARLSGVGLSAKTDPFKRARGWTNLADGVAPYLAEHPGSILVAEDRELLAHLIYRLGPPEYAAWNPEGNHPIDHYQLTTTLADKQGRHVIYVARHPDISGVSSHFTRSTLLGKVVVPVHKDFQREVQVYWLEGFKGY